MNTEEVAIDCSTACKNALNSVEDAMYVLGGKWKLRIIIALADGSKRFNELQRIVTGISARVLSSELKNLELNGLVVRKVDASTTSTSVEYERTEYAETLRTVLTTLHEWGAMHKRKITQR